MRIEIAPARADEVAAFYGRPLEYHLLKVNGVPMAMGGVVEAYGRLWGFLDTKEDIAVSGGGAATVRGIRAWLRSCGTDVYVPAQSQSFPTAERMLALIGFEPTDETWNGMRVWLWRN